MHAPSADAGAEVVVGATVVVGVGGTVGVRVGAIVGPVAAVLAGVAVAPLPHPPSTTSESRTTKLRRFTWTPSDALTARRAPARSLGACESARWLRRIREGRVPQ